MVAVSIGNKGTQALGQLALAWLLTKEDFGLIALAFTVTSLLGVFQKIGLTEILVKRHKQMDQWTPPAVSLALTLGIGGFLIVNASAPLAAALFHEPRITGLLRVMSLGIPFDALTGVALARLNADMRFRTVSLLMLMQLALAMGLSVLFALLGFGAYSIAIPRPIVAIIYAASVYSLSRPKIIAGPSVHKWMSLVRDGRWLMGTSACSLIAAYGDNFILGLVAPAAVVGEYYFAYAVAIQSVQMLVGSLQSTLYPALCQVADEPRRQVSVYLRACEVVCLIGCYGCFLQTAAARPVIEFVFHHKWDAAIPMFQVLSVAMGLGLSNGMLASLLQAQGRFRTQFGWMVSTAIAFVLAVTAGATLGQGMGVCVSLLGLWTVMAPIGCYLGTHSAGGRLRDWVRLLVLPPLVAAGAVLPVAIAMKYLGAEGLWHWAAWGVTMAVSLPLFWVLARIVAPQSSEEIVRRLPAELRRWARIGAGAAQDKAKGPQSS